MLVRRSLAAVAAVMLALVAAGCQEAAPEPKMPDPTSSSSAPEPTETESPEPEPESAEEFIRRWQAAGDEMQQTGEVNDFRRLSGGCAACLDLVKAVREVYADGGSIQFAGSEITRLQRIGQKPPTFNMDLDTAETVLLDATGQVDQTYPAGVGKYRVTLARNGRSWRVAHYGRR